MAALAWGARVAPAFRMRVIALANELGVAASDLMACMAFESGETFRADVRNAAGSGAVGLIQFMPSTAAALGTTTEKLAALTPEDQLEYVRAYFRPWKGRLKNLGDLYMAILWPGGVGKPDSYVLFDKADAAHPARYVQNRGLDWNGDGKITRAEACSRIVAKLAKGMRPENAFNPSAPDWGAEATRKALGQP
jgi:hypothetical protein